METAIEAVADQGGEGVCFWLKDPNLIELMQGFGRPLVVEVAVPLLVTPDPFWATKA